MADSPLGITFMPTADAAANGPRQASIEGQGGSTDLAAAFKILSLHLPRVLGASAIAPKRLLTSGGSSAVATPAGSSPYAAVFQSLLQSMAGGGSMGGYGSPDVAGLSSLFGGSSAGAYGDLGASGGAPSGGSLGSIPPPNISYGHDPGDAWDPTIPDTTPPASGGGSTYEAPYQNETQYI